MKARTTERVPTSELVSELLDADSFAPIRTRIRSRHLDAGPPGDGIICGSGRIGGRRVFCFAQDPDVLGGSLGEAQADAITRTLDLAARFRSPVIGIHRSAGARIQEGVGALAGYGRIFSRHVQLQGIVPQVALVFGPCAGGAAYGPALMDFLVMPAHGAYLFLTGPDVVRDVTGEQVGFEDLGGAPVAGRSGLATLVGSDERDTLELTRQLLGYLPDGIGDSPSRDPVWGTAESDPARVVPTDPRATYDIRDVARTVCDPRSFLELKPSAAPNLVTGFARIEGHPVGIIGNQPQMLAGAIDVAASQKGAWFVQLCERYRMPLVVLVDTPGFLPGTAQELGGVIPAGAGFLASFVRASVPKMTVVLRKAYGGAYIVMNASDLGADHTFAWPQAEIAVLGARGAVSVLERRRLAEADDPEAVRSELEASYRERHCSPWPAAEAGFIDEVIEPQDTRRRLAGLLDS